MTYSHQNKGNISSNIMIIITNNNCSYSSSNSCLKERMYNIFCVNIILWTRMMMIIN
jgi:hypothetical protein